MIAEPSTMIHSGKRVVLCKQISSSADCGSHIHRNAAVSRVIRHRPAYSHGPTLQGRLISMGVLRASLSSSRRLVVTGCKEENRLLPTIDTIKQLIVEHLKSGETKPSKLVSEVVETVENYVDSITDATPVPKLYSRGFSGLRFSEEFEAFLRSKGIRTASYGRTDVWDPEVEEQEEDYWDDYGCDFYQLILEFGRSLSDVPDENNDNFIASSLKKAASPQCELGVAWVPKNRHYHIDDYDGRETVIIGSVKDP